MGLDREKFTAAAKAQGYTDEQIEAELGPASAAVAPPSSAEQATAKNDAEFEATKPDTMDAYDNAMGKTHHTIWGGSVLDLNPFYK
jgi:hypothetical protein